MRKYKRGQISLLDGDTFTFAASTRQVVQLPIPATYLKRLWLNLRGTLTVSAVTVPGLPHLDGPANLIGQVELLVDGFPLKVGRAAHFLRIAQKYDQTEGVNAGILSGAAGVYNFQALIPLMFEMPASVGPFDSVEDGRLIRNMTLALTWGTTGDLIVGNTSTLALTNTTCEVYLEDTEPNFQRNENDIFRFRQTDTSFLGIVTSAGTRLILPVPDLGGVFRSILLKSIDGANLSDAIINNVVALRVNGSDEVPFNNIEDDFFQAQALYHFGMDFMPDGYYHIELAEGGLVRTTGLGARGVEIKSLDAILNTTVGAGATSITAHVCELFPYKRG